MRSFLFKTKNNNFYDLNPAFLIVTGLICGIVLQISDNHLFYYITAASAVFALFLLYDGIQYCIKFLISFSAGFMLSLFYNSPPENSYTRFIPENKNCGAVITVQITDTRAAGPSLPWLPVPKYIKADILSLQYSQEDNIHQVSGKTVIKLPNSNSVHYQYGDILKLNGAFFTPDANSYGHFFSFKDYLLSTGVKHIFKARTVQTVKKTFRQNFFINTVRNCIRHILHLRNAVLRNLTDNMHEQYKRIFASLFFGCRQGLSYSSKQQYIKSGIIHIFAISGLHVGLLALNLFLIFFFLPCRIKYLIVCAVLFTYVTATGLQASALRAFLMIFLWSLHRIYLKSISPLNSLFIAAMLSLLINPMNILSTGFHYSFTVTAFLLISWKTGEKLLKILNTEIHLKPDMTNTNLILYSIRNKLINTIHTAAVCWLSSSGLNAMHGNLFIPGAVLCNILIIPFVWLLFCIVSINFFVSFFSSVLAPVQETVLKIINIIAESGSHYTSAFFIGKVHPAFIIIYFTALFFLTAPGSVKVFSYAAASVITVAGVIFCIRILAPPQAVIISGSGTSPETIIAVPAKTGSTIVNAGSYEKVRKICSILQCNGINSVDTLILPDSKSNTCRGAESLFAKFTIRELVIPYSGHNSYFLKKIIKAAENQHTEITYLENKEQAKLYSSAVTEFSYSAEKQNLKMTLPQFHLRYTVLRKENSPRRINLQINRLNKNYISGNSLKPVEHKLISR